MAKHLDKFTRPFQDSSIPFALAEVLTNGSGEMVDLVCRFLNSAAGDLLQLPPEDVQGRRLTQLAPALPLEALSPIQTVAFSGSAAAFPWVTAGGVSLSVTCYQVMYGVVGCLLDPSPAQGGQDREAPLPEALPAAVLELSRTGLRCLACNQRLCQLTRWSQKGLLNQGTDAFSALVAPADWPALLQALLDAARENRAVDHDFRLVRRDGGLRWVNLQAELRSSRQGTVIFRGTFVDIDRFRREALTLREQLSRQTEALRQSEHLLETTPVGLCLLRSQSGHPVELLRVNQTLCRLLALPQEALARRMAEDPGGFFPSGEREELLAAAVRARECRLPLHRVCRVCGGSGQLLCLSLHADWEETAGGAWLVSIACTDVTQEAAADAEHRVRAQMCDLLLEHTALLTLDYDPAEDLAQIQRHSPSGGKTTRTISGYLKSLSSAPYLHPEDRRRLAGAIRRALTHPGTISCSYRADYSGTGWRQYQISWMSLFDGQGDVYRLLGKAEDVTGKRAAAEHFRRLAGRRRKESKSLLASARLDLTADETLDTKAASRHLLRTLFDRTAAACLQRMADALPEAAERAQFAEQLSPPALADAFAAGTFQRTLTHRISTGKGAAALVETTAELAENPDTLHLELFLQMRDLGPSRLRDALLDALTSQDGTVVLTVDAATGACRAYGSASERLPQNAAYRALAAWYFRQLPPTPARGALRNALTLEQVLAQLETSPAVELELPSPEGHSDHLRCSRLAGVPDTLLVLLNHL